MRRFGGLLAALLIACCGVGVLAGPAYADDVPPQMLSADRISPAALGGGAPVLLRANVSDGGDQGSGVASVRFDYGAYDSSGAKIVWLQIDSVAAPVNGVITAQRLLTPWAAQAHYQLDHIDVTDFVGNDTRYDRDGTARSQTGTAQPPLGFALSELDFDVSNAASDIAGPVVSGLHPLRSTVQAGTPLILTSQPSDDRAGLGRLAVAYTGPSGQTIMASTDEAVAAAGVVSAVFPAGSEGGLWRATTVDLWDRTLNRASYLRNGQTIYTPSGIRTFTAQPPIDWNSLDVQVNPLAPDRDAPILSDLNRDDTGTVHAGDDLTIRYTAHDASPIVDVVVLVMDSGGHVFDLLNQCMPERGFAVDALPAGFDTGPAHIEAITIRDDSGNSRTYYRDGTTNTSADYNKQPGLDLTRLDFSITGGTGDGPHAAPTRLACPQLARLPLTVPANPAAGQSVPITGQVLDSVNRPVPNVDVAVLQTPAGSTTRLVAMALTDADGRYAATLPAPEGSVVVRVQFLGQRTLLPALSAVQTVTPMQRQQARASISSTRSAYRAPVRVIGSLVPRRPGARLELQIPNATGWRTIQTQSTRGDGTTAFTLLPARGTHQYRIYCRSTTGWAAALSSTVKVTVY